MDYVFLAVSGFLLGSVLYAAWYTTRYEPTVKIPYALICMGVLIVASLNAWIDFVRDRSDWFRGFMLFGYAVVAIGLVTLTRERKNRGQR